MTGLDDDPRLLQVSVPIQQSNSGGPLFNSSGEVVRVVVSKLDAASVWNLTGDLPKGVNYALKAGYLRPLLESTEGAEPRDGDAESLEDLAADVKPSVVLVVAQ